MIDEKKISKAAKEYAVDTWNHEEEQFSCMDGFKVGAKWALQGFKKSLWHKPKEIPETNRWILVEYMGDRLCYDTIQSAFNNWAKIRSYCHITKWCYIDNLLPTKGGEQ